MDDRTPDANKYMTGGLLQSLTYFSGLSGGGFPVMSFSLYDFPTADDILSLWQPQINRLAAPGDTEYAATFTSMFTDIAAKFKAGFKISVADLLGRVFAYQFVNGTHGGVDATISGLVNHTKFINHQMPFPIFQTAVVTDDDVEYFGVQVSYANSAIYEINPLEFGCWQGLAKQFTPTEWLETQFINGTVANSSACVRHFDSASFMLGAEAAAFNFWYIEGLSNDTLAQFQKRSIDSTSLLNKRSIARRDDLPPKATFPVSTINLLVGAFNQTFGLGINDIMYAWVPNLFRCLASTSSQIRSSPYLRLVDHSENGQSLPLWSQIQPVRNSSFIIAWDETGDATYNWNNGTNLCNTYLYANNTGVPFPIVPSASTVMARNYTIKPVFFGCDAKHTTTKGTRSPIVLYYANAPYSTYSNISYTQANASVAQLKDIWVNSFNMLTQGNGTLDKERSVCLGCAAIERSLEKVGLKRTKQGQRCFDKYCWDGVAKPELGTVLVNPTPVLQPGLSFAEWNRTHGY